jgi:hypothetical protein
LLDLEKSIYFFLLFFAQEENFTGHTRPQNLGRKNRKNDLFKANPRLVK